MLKLKHLVVSLPIIVWISQPRAASAVALYFNFPRIATTSDEVQIPEGQNEASVRVTASGGSFHVINDGSHIRGGPYFGLAVDDFTITESGSIGVFSGNSFPPQPENTISTPIPTTTINVAKGDHFTVPLDFTTDLSLKAGGYTPFITINLQSSTDILFYESSQPNKGKYGGGSSTGSGVEVVPEPLNILGSGLALGAGVLFKREYSKKRKKI